ncbi:hypothetical protein MUN82_02095 [Hymenobacter aerilatus]|uniref:Uncharacterized protein n=1 Tax=Hymenobacter aerilatus TaxID=2932251 RepID=A0A8T9SUR4_9BACT|nr:hypothetical protein [Hymenobacter aerilatus]UOR05902.1 hypothetical protein MUN82_02095 [Hymenobacter aerilatus]
MPKRNPVAVTFSEHLLGNFRNDTLVLSANYSECGEFGGHREMIKIYMRAEEQRQARQADWNWAAVPLTAVWYLDTARCSQPNSMLSLVKQQQITVSHEEAIVEYIQTMLTRNLADNGMTLTNGSNRYSVKRTNRESLHVEYRDVRRAWDGFERLRERIFEK